MTPKDLINEFYQPLGHLGCKVSSSVMWTYAKEKAIFSTNERIDQLNKCADYWNIKEGEWYKDELKKLEYFKQELLKL